MKRLVTSWGFSAACLVFIADRLAKWVVQIEPNMPRVITSWFSIDYVLNRGISWGLFSYEHTLGFALLSIIITLILALITWWTYRLYHHHEAVTPQLLIIAGGFSNIIDRVIYHGVIDYIGLTIFGWHFAWFNIADAAINIGVLMLILRGITHE